VRIDESEFYPYNLAVAEKINVFYQTAASRRAGQRARANVGSGAKYKFIAQENLLNLSRK
jgi:hypothetical protein